MMKAITKLAQVDQPQFRCNDCHNAKTTRVATPYNPGGDLAVAYSRVDCDLHRFCQRHHLSFAIAGTKRMTNANPDELAQITLWEKAQCATEWTKLTGHDAGRRLSTAFLRNALIFERRCKNLGGHGAAVKQQLRNHAADIVKDDSTSPSKPMLTPRTQLVRE